MTKNKKKENDNLSFLSFLNSVIDLKMFSKDINYRNLNIYVGISFLIIVLLILIKLVKVTGISNLFQNFLAIIIFIPIIFFIFYSFFYLFLNSFESNRKPFFKSFMIFLAILSPFLILGNFITILKSFIFNSIINIFLNLIIFVLVIYLLINLIISFKNYYNTSSFRIISSLLLVEVFFWIFIILQTLFKSN